MKRVRKYREGMAKIKTIIVLNIILMIYSLSGFFSKSAARYDLFSLKFILFYGIMLLILAGYAICWQQIIKRLPLTLAYANKAVTIVWGIVWGFLFFGEGITVGKLTGAGLVILGVVLYVIADNEGENG